MGYLGNNRSLETDHMTSLNMRVETPGAGGAFRNGQASGGAVADFDQGLAPLNSYGQGSARGSYAVRAGDSLASIAASLWGDASLWWKLAEANGLSGASALMDGQRLTIPAGVIKNTYNAATFAPYDPAAAMGDTAPTNPVQPRPGGNTGCGVIGQIILVIIAVVVTIYAPTIAPGVWEAAFGTGFVSGAAAAAAGSAVSQGVGVATGIQEKFSWNAVALAAVGGGVSAGLSGGASGASASGTAGAGSAIANGWQAAGRAVLTNLATQGVGLALGWQSKFSWAGLAASGVGAGLAKAIAGKALGDYLSPTNAGLNVAAQTASGIANAAIRSLISGTDFGDNLMAALPDVIGSTIGGAIAGRATGRGRPSRGGDGPLTESETMDAIRRGYDNAGIDHGGRYQVADRSGGVGKSGGWWDAVGDFFSGVGDFLGFDGRLGPGGSVEQTPSSGHVGDAMETVVVTAGRTVNRWRTDFMLGWTSRPPSTPIPMDTYVSAGRPDIPVISDIRRIRNNALAQISSSWELRDNKDMFNSAATNFGVEVRGALDNLSGHASVMFSPVTGLVYGTFGRGYEAISPKPQYHAYDPDELRSRATDTVFALAGVFAGPEMLVAGLGTRTQTVSRVPDALRAGRLAEPNLLDALGSSRKVSFTPTEAQANSAAFRVIVGEPRYTPSGKLEGTVYDGLTANGLFEVKTGTSVLASSYQLRLQTYGGLINKPPLSYTIHTSRPLNPTFNDWLTRWGVAVKKLPE